MKILFVFLAGFAALGLHARIGETALETERRFGKAIKEFEGFGAIDKVEVHQKDGIEIISVFNRAYKENALVIYSRGSLLERESRRGVIPLKELEIDSLFESEEGIWETPEIKRSPAKKTLTPGAGFAGPMRNGKPSPRKSKRLEPVNMPKPSSGELTDNEVQADIRECKRTLERFIVAITSEVDGKRLGSARLEKGGQGHGIFDSYGVGECLRNGRTRYSFKLAQDGEIAAIVFMSADFLDEIDEWTKRHYLKMQPKTEKDKGRALSGF